MPVPDDNPETDLPPHTRESFQPARHDSDRHLGISANDGPSLWWCYGPEIQVVDSEHEEVVRLEPADLATFLGQLFFEDDG